MRTVEIKIYKFGELNKEAQEKAINKFRENYEYHSESDVLETIKIGLRHFDSQLRNYYIDFGNVNNCRFRIDMMRSSNVKYLNGLRLWKYINNNGYLKYLNRATNKIEDLLSGNCPFTGVCFDEDFLDNIRSFIKKPINTTFKKLLEDAVCNTINAACKDYEYQISDISIIETLEANDYDFYENGKIYQ